MSNDKGPKQVLDYSSLPKRSVAVVVGAYVGIVTLVGVAALGLFLFCYGCNWIFLVLKNSPARDREVDVAAGLAILGIGLVLLVASIRLGVVLLRKVK